MERRAVTVRGIVQGVGFRPFVSLLASELRLSGFVKNQTGDVLIEVEGEEPSLDQFMDHLQSRPPPLSQIDEVSWHRQSPLGEQRFRIERSAVDAASQVFISPDMATCADCLAELFDPRDRRYRYPFLNCTHCGPRLTIIQGAPYDRAQTTMRGFVMCHACGAEYADPDDRRFHAQPTACPECGPQLEFLDSTGQRTETNDPLTFFAEALQQGQIGALKGLGGYHLACHADNSRTVCELRQRKHRDEMPLAVMVSDVDAARRLCEVNAEEQALLESPRRPIVLLRKRAGLSAPPVCEAVAPGNPYLGIMLPYTPLHHLLMRAANGVPLVMTSGNCTDEPIAYRDDEAFERLKNIADVFLRHNRRIHVRCDDSVTRIIDGVELPVRRSRGYAPQPIKLPLACPCPMLATGGQLKGVFALGCNRHAFLSHHMGDLDHFQAYRDFERDILLYQELFRIRPELIVHDLHPDYASTHYALQRADQEGLPRLAVQHHHAHMASCMAEHGLDEPVIGVSFDGTGFGTDEITRQPTIWGGEFLTGDYRSFRRAAHLRYVPMPGAEMAVREPWRMAAAHLTDAGVDLSLLEHRIKPTAIRSLATMLARRINSPLTSSAGRLFDAAASIAGARDTTSYEGQAAMQWEWLATDVEPDAAYPFEILAPEADASHPAVIDTRPLIRTMADERRKGTPVPRIARRFHSTMVDMVADVCVKIRQDSGLDAVVLSGGVFMNALLTHEITARLSEAGFRVYRHRRVPPNDAGLCLGQMVIAAANAGHPSNSSSTALQYSMVTQPISH